MIELSKDYHNPNNLKCEVWRKINEFEYYALSNHGRVRRTDRGNLITPEIAERKNGSVVFYFKLYENGKRYTYTLKQLMTKAGFEPDTEPPQKKPFELVYRKTDEFIYNCF